MSLRNKSKAINLPHHWGQRERIYTTSVNLFQPVIEDLSGEAAYLCSLKSTEVVSAPLGMVTWLLGYSTDIFDLSTVV